MNKAYWHQIQKTFQIIILSTLLLSIFSWAKPVPIEHFAKGMEYFDAVISPDGRYIAVERAADQEKTLVAIVKTDDLSLQGHVPATTDESPINPLWVTDERLIVEFTEASKRYEQEFINGELTALNADGKNLKRIVEHQIFISNQPIKRLNALHGIAQVVHTLPDEEKHVLIRFHEFTSTKVIKPETIYRINTSSGKLKTVTVAPSLEANFTFSASGEPLYAFGIDKKRAKEGNYLVTHKFVDGKWELLGDVNIDADQIQVIAEGKQDNEIIVLAEFEQKTDRIYAYNFDTKEKKVLFAHGEVDPSSWDKDPVTNQIVAIHFDAGYPNIHIVDPEHVYSRWYPALYQVFEGKRVKITSATKDGGKLIVHVSAPTEPGQFHLFDTNTKKLRYLFNAANWIDTARLSDAEPFSIKARDDNPIHGYLTIPKEGVAPHPLIVLPHGGPHGIRDYWRYDQDVQFLASRGYAVLQPNFRGSGGYGLGFKESGYRKWGAEIQYDIIDSTRWALARADIDDTQVCIMGSSFGGYSALMSPIVEPDLFKCAIGIVGVYDLNLMWKAGDTNQYRLGKNSLDLFIGKDKAELSRFSPALRANELKIPVFLAHGKRDWRADVKHFYAMKKALEKQKHPLDTMLIKKEGHGFGSEKNRKDLYSKIEKFLSKNL